MPIYEYACRTCGEAFERRLKFEERLQSQVCPSCGNEGAVLRISAPARVGRSTSGSIGGDVGFCPSSGQPCGCDHAIRN